MTTWDGTLFPCQSSHSCLPRGCWPSGPCRNDCSRDTRVHPPSTASGLRPCRGPSSRSHTSGSIVRCQQLSDVCSQCEIMRACKAPVLYPTTHGPDTASDCVIKWLCRAHRLTMSSAGSSNSKLCEPDAAGGSRYGPSDNCLDTSRNPLPNLRSASGSGPFSPSSSCIVRFAASSCISDGAKPVTVNVNTQVRSQLSHSAS